MNKWIKRGAVVLTAVVAAGCLLTACSSKDNQDRDTTNAGVSNEQAAKDAPKENAKDKLILGTWKGVDDDGDPYQITFYNDKTYEDIEIDKNNPNEKDITSGSYDIRDGQNLVLNREKELKQTGNQNANAAVEADKEINTVTYDVQDNKLLILKDSDGHDQKKLEKQDKVADKNIK